MAKLLSPQEERLEENKGKVVLTGRPGKISETYLVYPPQEFRNHHRIQRILNHLFRSLPCLQQDLKTHPLHFKFLYF